MEGRFRECIRQKLIDALAAPVVPMTRRDVHLPAVAGKAVAVIGMRRTGKTTFLRQVLADRLAGGSPRAALVFFSFEDERLAGMTAAELHLLLEEYFRLQPEFRERVRVTLFLDEIQVVPGWEAFARRILDSEQIDLFVSGSSARLLSREVATSMRGRAMEALVHPFSFREYLRHLGREPDRAVHRLPKPQRSSLERDLRDYLVAGGFPEAVGLTAPRDRFDLLRGYVDVVLLRDVIERHAVSQPVALRWMTRHLLANAAGRFSVAKIHADLRSQGIGVAKDTLHEFLGHLEDSFLIRSVPVAADSERKRMVNPRKAYPVDPGLIPVFDRSGRGNVGHALETCVLLELERRGAETAYVRTDEGYEVDFLVRIPGRGEELIQVCADLYDPKVLDREVRALVAAGREHPRAARRLVGLEPEPPADLPDGVVFRPASAWLLDASSA